MADISTFGTGKPAEALPGAPATPGTLVPGAGSIAGPAGTGQVTVEMPDLPTRKQVNNLLTAVEEAVFTVYDRSNKLQTDRNNLIASMHILQQIGSILADIKLQGD